jgi:hypothetical protein
MYISTEIAERNPMDVGAPPIPFHVYYFFSYVPYISQPRGVVDGLDDYIVVTNKIWINGES